MDLTQFQSIDICKILYIAFIVLTFQKGTLENTQFKIMQFLFNTSITRFPIFTNVSVLWFFKLNVIVTNWIFYTSVHPLLFMMLTENKWCSMYKRSSVLHHPHISCPVLCKVSSIHYQWSLPLVSPLATSWYPYTFGISYCESASCSFVW